ncbi:3-deoxy-7-phosphoheptulonate synthase [Candidatus Pseudothioglobus singularis]|nr:3-deoxy-7-phosphoheptulonate synthase [Candidatus Pseudothioglobus singularis]MDA7438170.1 3-deoxy-7-phosphoheptulonate synthase [Candidatus Pseudothioglobus singularis]MDB4598251.1 3-deoxy-7-phosphoheptulonate synthase [Candidatus Pseudothioglobus singularis]
MTNQIHNKNIETETVITSPIELRQQISVTEQGKENILSSRNTVEDIFLGNDDRLIVIVGPCSIHDINAAKEYALKLLTLQKEVEKSIFIVMRVYFEKPRTTVGWKGLISDPDMDNSLDVEKGLRQGRELLAWLAEKNIPTGTEALNPITPQYLADLISWCAIGARTTESQTHREMSSGLSMPVGFKNGTDGNLTMAINAIKACSSKQSFLGINDQGQISTFKAKGNKSSHIILRGGAKPNYDEEAVKNCEKLLKENDLAERIMIDCSHDNSNQDYRNQGKVIEDIKSQILLGNKSIFGVMLESNLFSGKQKILDNKDDMQYGVSVTDGCIDWQETEEVIRSLSKAISK